MATDCHCRSMVCRKAAAMLAMMKMEKEERKEERKEKEKLCVFA
ncbi:MAG TPA: hypothetical protein PLO51_03850 [Candidatus Micrarchaeota archaeon]|nr:hypothetical protein [Candidatus Micrarchaeota archaeon]